MGRAIRTEAAALSDRGRLRTNNEDAFFVDPQGRLFLVADGLGGHAGGEVASALVAETLGAAAAAEPSWLDPVRELRTALEHADARVRARATDELTGMGATVAALYLADERALVAHAGDSRIYRLHAGTLQLLTRDHTPEAEGLIPASDRRSHCITRAVGVGEQTVFDLAWADVAPGDRFLLCSDGLTDMLPDPRIAALLAGAGGPAALAAALVAAALATGGKDNVTVVVVQVC